MFKKFEQYCRMKKWEVYHDINFQCADGSTTEVSCANVNKDSYSLIGPLTDMRTALQVPTQETNNGSKVWRIFTSYRYRADSNWWQVTNPAFAIYCISVASFSELCNKFGFGTVVSDIAIRSAISEFLILIDKNQLSTCLDITYISSSDISLSIHRADIYGGAKEFIAKLEQYFTKSFETLDLNIQRSKWIIHEGLPDLTLSIPYAYHGNTKDH